MFGIITQKGKVPFIDLDEFIDIEKMKYFNRYLEEQLYNKFLNQSNPPDYLKPFIENRDIHSVFSTYYDDITLEQSWNLIDTYIPEIIDYLNETIMEDIGGFFILNEVDGSAPNFHRDWGEDTTGEKHQKYGLVPTEKEARKVSENWIWFRFSDTKKLYISDIDGKDDISKRILVESYGVYFNGLDYHGSYEESSGFSIRLHGTLKKNIIEKFGII
tara:strand:+ start:1108 stop:1755 length:648 start_codon:yes stop_codon:yes gene_type:complete